MIDLHIGRQTFDFDCGAKALQIVMAYYGVEVREDELMDDLGTGEEGTPITTMVNVAERYGFQVHSTQNWSLFQARQYIDQQHPVIVLLQAWAKDYMTIADWRKNNEDGHYAILIGYGKRVVYFEDPASFRRTWLRDREFLARWHDRDPRTNEMINHFGMVLLGRDPAIQRPKHMD